MVAPPNRYVGLQPHTEQDQKMWDFITGSPQYRDLANNIDPRSLTAGMESETVTGEVPSWGEIATNAAEYSLFGRLVTSDILKQKAWQDTGYSASEDPDILDPTKPYHLYADDFAATTNHEYAAKLKSYVDQELYNKDLWKRSTWAQWFAGGSIDMLLDPTNYLTGAIAGAALKTGVAAYRGGQAAIWGASSAAAMLAYESTRQATEPTRSWKDAAVQTAIGSALGAFFGGLIPTATAGELGKITGSAIKNVGELSDDPIADAARYVASQQTAGLGADVAQTLTKEDLGFKTSFGEGVAKRVGWFFQDPALRLMTSPSVTARDTIARLTENSARVKLHVDGKTLENNVEMARRGWTAQWSTAANAATDAYKNARKTGNKISLEEFDNLTYSMYKDMPIVEPPKDTLNYWAYKAAKAWDEMYQWSGRQARSAAALKTGREATEMATSSMPRIIDHDAMSQNGDAFRGLVEDYLTLNIPKSGFRSEDDLKDYIKQVAQDTWSDLIRRTTDDPTGVTEGLKVVVRDGPLKKRDLLIPENYTATVNGKEVKFTDFFNRNMREVSHYYMKRMGARTELTRAFGDHNLKQVLDKLKTEYTDLELANPENVKAIRNRYNEDVNNIMRLRDMHLGVFNEKAYLSTSGKTITGINRLLPIFHLGMLTISSLPDMVMSTTAAGLRGFFSDWAPAMLRALPELATGNRGIVLSKETKEALVEMGTAIETFTHQRAASMMDIILDKTQINQSTGQQLINKASDTFFTASLINYWTDMAKSVAGNVTIGRIIRNSQDYAKNGIVRNKWERQFMARMGIDGTTMRAIADKHAAGVIQKKQGFWDLDIRSWTDDALFEKEFAKIDADTAARKEVIKRKLKGAAPKGNTIKDLKAHKKEIEDLYDEFKMLDRKAEEAKDVIRSGQDRIVRKIRGAVGAETNRLVVTPGVADLPNYMTGSPIGRLLLAFKSFIFASNKKVLMAGFQGSPARLLASFVTAQAAGMFVALLKEKVKGNDDNVNKMLNTEEGFSTLIGAGLEENPYLSIFSMGANMLNSVTRNTAPFPTLREMPGMVMGHGRGLERDTRRYQQQSVAEIIGGPAAGMADNIIRSIVLLGELALNEEKRREGLTEQQTRNLLKLVPGQSLFYLRPFVENSIIEPRFGEK